MLFNHPYYCTLFNKLVYPFIDQTLKKNGLDMGTISSLIQLNQNI